jgi:multiple sugar transport system substrate-binding protein
VFFDYLFSEEAYGDFLNAEPGLFVPVTATGATYASWLNNEVLAKYPEQVKMMLEATSKGALFGFTDGVCMDIGNITGPNLLAQTLQNMTINGMTAEEAVKWGQEAMEAAVSK